jgi:type I restriction enzyme S subunit
MNTERFLAHYHEIADAPDAIARLRRFILDLAVRGKLVAQDATDEPASELLTAIVTKRGKLAEAGIVRPGKALAEKSNSKKLFDLPRGWAWTNANQMWDFENGDRSKNYPSKDQLVAEGIPFINAGHLVGGLVSLENMNFISQAKYNQLGGGKLRLGDQLYCLRGSLGKHAIFLHKGDAAIASSLVILRPIEPETVPYLSRYLDSDIALMMLKRFDNGTAQPNLSSANLRLYEIPLPPLAEQHRIIAKVDELMALCDQLEAARRSREAVRDRLAVASLARLNAPDPETFRADARFALDALAALTTRPDQIKQVRQTILNLAVRGKLVPQDPKDEPASELLKRVVRQRKQLVADRKIRGANPPPPPPSLEEEIFGPPSTWQLCSLGQITIITDPNPSHRYPDYSGGTVPILSTREFSGDDGWNPETAKLTTEAFWQFQREICDFAEGDIIFARKGRLGLPRYLPNLDRFTFSHTLFVLKPMTGLDPAYLLWLLRRDEV